MIHEVTSPELFAENMGRFNKKWGKAANGQGLIDASCFKDLFYIVKKHAHLSILSELQSLIEKRRTLLHENELEEYANVAKEIIELQRKAN
jgi:hypothetical protein